MNSKRWTDSEIATVRRMAVDGATDREIGRAIDRTRLSVQQKRRRLGLTAPRHQRWRRWSDDDIQKLMRMVSSGEGDQSIADALDRSRPAVAVKKGELGLRSQQDYRHWSLAEEEWLRANWGALSVGKLAETLRHTELAVFERARLLGLIKPSRRKYDRGESNG